MKRKRTKKSKKNVSTIFLVAILIAGLLLLIYPSFSDYWNSFHQSRAISDYADSVSGMNSEEYQEIWNAATEYNASLSGRSTNFSLTDAQKAEYESLLDISGIGVMGYVEIPQIKCSLPIYHGTEESVLQVAVGHLEWSSLPVGGAGSHCVLSGHRGLPSAKLFTDIDKLEEGDIFMLRVLDEVMTYEVDQIHIVEPQDTSALRIIEGEDLCTLVTCTPYGINSHRLLVRGHRIDNLPESGNIRITAEAMQVDPMIVSAITAIAMLLLLLIVMLLPKGSDAVRSFAGRSKGRKVPADAVEEITVGEDGIKDGEDADIDADSSS